MGETTEFTEDDIRLPKKVVGELIFGILHDLAWADPWDKAWKWVSLIQRARRALRQIDVR